MTPDTDQPRDRLFKAWDNAETVKPPDILAEFTNPVDLTGIEPPPREWIVDGWLPVGTVTSLYGTGGVGKTLLAQLLQSAVGTGRPFLGIDTTQCRVMSFYCEDDQDELHRRQVCVNVSMGIGMQDLGAVRWQSRFGKPNVMATVDGGLLKSTDFYDYVRTTAKRFGARLVIIDNIAQVFAGGESTRTEVTQFINSLGTIAQEINGAVLLLGHPGKADNSEYSGSTAWDACVRSRWILERPKEDLDEQDAGELADLRVLRRAKANYAKKDDEITMRWDAGTFRAEGPARWKDAVDRIEERLQEKADDAAFIAGLHTLLRTGFEPSFKVESRASYAPKLLKKAAPECHTMSVATLRRVMDRLLKSGDIVLGWSAGPPSRRKAIIVPKGHDFTQGSDTPSQPASDTYGQGSDTPSHCDSDPFEHPTDTYGQGSQVIDIIDSQTGYEHPTDTYGPGSQVIDIIDSHRYSDTPLYTTYIEDGTSEAVPSSEDTGPAEKPREVRESKQVIGLDLNKPIVKLVWHKPVEDREPEPVEDLARLHAILSQGSRLADLSSRLDRFKPPTPVPDQRAAI
jgi:RecA-family ATPase